MFSRQVQVGRVVNVTFGEDIGKLAVVVEVIDAQRVLVDGPSSGVKRQAMSFKRCNLTDIVLDIPRSIGTVSLKAAIQKQDLAGKWAKTAWAKKMNKRALRAGLNDYDRFKLMVARKQKSTIVGKAAAKLRKAANK